jgi:hypothetical protein
MWHNTLLQDLCWVRSGGFGAVIPRPSPMFAPTWSWASINDGVTYLYQPESDTVFATTLIDVSCSYLDNEEYGQIKSAKLVLYGKTVQCSLEFENDEQYYYFTLHSRTAGSIKIHHETDCTLYLDCKHEDKLHGKDTKGAAGKRIEVYLLCLYEKKDKSFWMILEKATNGNMYRRIGGLVLTDASWRAEYGEQENMKMRKMLADFDLGGVTIE